MTDIQAHPFERTLGPGPYRFVGMFSINIEAGKQGRPYVNPHEMHPRFVTGCGTCAHCGHAILNVCQIQIGNGDVYGVGTDCIYKVGIPHRELSALQKAELARQKALRAERKARKGAAARAELRALMAERHEELERLPHVSDHMAKQGATLLDYAAFIEKNSNDGGVVIALKRIQFLLKEGK